MYSYQRYLLVKLWGPPSEPMYSSNMVGDRELLCLLAGLLSCCLSFCCEVLIAGGIHGSDTKGFSIRRKRTVSLEEQSPAAEPTSSEPTSKSEGEAQADTNDR